MSPTMFRDACRDGDSFVSCIFAGLVIGHARSLTCDSTLTQLQHAEHSVRTLSPHREASCFASH